MLRRKSKRKRRSPARSRPIQLQKLEPRNLLAAVPLGASDFNTGGFLLGSVGVTPVLFESDGTIDPESQDWSTQEIADLLAKVDEGVNWWSDTLDAMGTVHDLEFVIDDTFAVDPVETPYEPIDRSSTFFDEYVKDFMESLGYGDAPSLERAVQLFNHDQRAKLGTDWAFTIFVVDSSDDPDGLFASGGQFSAAFAFAGGLFLVTPSSRPASTITHEMGHIFWARDEYPGGGSWLDQRGYYNAQNLNAADNPTPGFEQQISIMRGGFPLSQAFEQHFSPESTFALVGWRDSDGDGVFDLADVPLDLDAVGYADADSSQYHFAGTASAVPLFNQNSSGVQSDMTLNRISEIQYRLDDGPWRVAATPDQQVVEFDLTVTIDEPYSSIRWRAIDEVTGITSPIVEGVARSPAISTASVSGYAFIDENDDGIRNPSEELLPGATATIRNADGSPLFGGGVTAAQFGDDVIPAAEVAGVTLSAEGVTSDEDLGSFISASAGDQRVFHSFDAQRNRWTDRWSERAVLVAEFDQVVGEVDFDAIGLGQSNYGRIEAYDVAGNLIARFTTDEFGANETRTMSVTDPQGRIKSIRAFGFAGTNIALTNLRFGFTDTAVTDESGTWKLPNLADGTYSVNLVPERLIHQFAHAAINLQVSGGTSSLIVGAAERVTSPRHNSLLAEDVNENGEVTSVDALIIINDMNRNQSRILGPTETEGPKIDVNNDGAVTALDALLVINALDRDNTDGAEAESGVESGNGAGAQSLANPDHQASPEPVEAVLANDQVIASWTNDPFGAATMFDSAGDAVRSESTTGPTTDTSERALTFSPNTAQTPVGKDSGGGENVAEAAEQRVKSKENTGETAQSLESFPLEITEPFRQSLV